MNTIMKHTRHFMVLAALVFASALSVSAVTLNVGYVSSSISFSFSANTDADIYIRNLDTNQVVARGWYDYFSGAHAETYEEGVEGYGSGDWGEIYNLTPGNYEVELWGPGTLLGSGFSNGSGSASFSYGGGNSISFWVN